MHFNFPVVIIDGLPKRTEGVHRNFVIIAKIMPQDFEIAPT